MKKIIVKTLVLSGLTLGLFVACSKAKNVTPKVDNVGQSTTYDFRTDNKIKEALNALTSNANAKENDDDNNNNENVDMAKINAVYALTPASVRRQAFTLLTTKEKFVFWNNLTDIKIDNSNLNESQKDLLEDLQETFLKKKFFTEQGTNLRNAFVNNQAQIKTQLNNAGITDLMFYNIFMSGRFSAQDPQPQDVLVGGHTPSCGCNVGSAFNFSNCGGQCSSASSGCGFFWSFSCNGRSFYINALGDPRYLDEA